MNRALGAALVISALVVCAPTLWVPLRFEVRTERRFTPVELERGAAWFDAWVTEGAAAEVWSPEEVPALRAKVVEYWRSGRRPDTRYAGWGWVWNAEVTEATEELPYGWSGGGGRRFHGSYVRWPIVLAEIGVLLLLCGIGLTGLGRWQRRRSTSV